MIHNTSDISNYINNLEAEFCVSQWKLEEVEIWPLLRLSISMQLLHKINKSSHSSGTKVKLLEDDIKLLEKLLCKAGVLESSRYEKSENEVDVIFLTDNHFCSKIGEYWFDRCVDSLNEFLKIDDISSFILEKNSFTCNYPKYSNSESIQLQINRLKKQAFSEEYSEYKVRLSGFERFQEKLKKDFTDLTIPTLDATLKRVRWINKMKSYFKEVLIDLDPKIAFQVNFFTYSGMAFNMACKETGIICVELQHGAALKNHVAYHKWENMPEKGYAAFPDYYWCWTEQNKHQIDAWLPYRTILGGNLFVHYYKNKIVKDRIKRFPSKDPKKIDILISLQPGFGINNELLRVIQDTNLDMRWWIKKHPTEPNINDSKLHELVGMQHVDLYITNQMSLYETLQFIDVHITEFSSVVLEAEAFEKPSIVMHSRALSLYEDQINTSWCVHAENSLSIKDAIFYCIKLDKKKRSKSSIATDATESAIAQLKDYIKSSKEDKK